MTYQRTIDRKMNYGMAIPGLVLLGFLMAGSSPVAAQQENDFDKIFDEMMKEFFPPELRKEIESLREKQSDSDREEKEGTLSSFYKENRKFQELKQRELQNRKMDRMEKQHPSNLEAYRSLSEAVSDSVVAIFGDQSDRQLVYATAVTDHLLVTKADRLEGLTSVTCRDRKNRSMKAKVVKIDKVHDLAILKTDFKLSPISRKAKTYEEGSFLVSVGNIGSPLAMGTLAVKPRSVIGKDRGFLGVEPAPSSSGVKIEAVTEGSAARRAGIMADDVVTSIDKIKMSTVAELVTAIGSKKQGELIKLDILRNGQKIQIEATLDGRNQRGERAARFEVMRRLGAVLSRRHGEYPSVLEHDTPLLPDQCGSPLVDLDQRIVGINIARAGRTSSYALPIDLVNRIVEEFQKNPSR